MGKRERDAKADVSAWPPWKWFTRIPHSHRRTSPLSHPLAISGRIRKASTLPFWSKCPKNITTSFLFLCARIVRNITGPHGQPRILFQLLSSIKKSLNESKTSRRIFANSILITQMPSTNSHPSKWWRRKSKRILNWTIFIRNWSCNGSLISLMRKIFLTRTRELTTLRFRSLFRTFWLSDFPSAYVYDIRGHLESL